MKKLFSFPSTAPSLRRQYYFIFLTIALLVLSLLAGYATYTYQQFQRKIFHKLTLSANAISQELERGFDDNQALLKHLGEIIVKTRSHQDVHGLAKILMSTGKFGIRSLATSYVGWATSEGLIIVSGKHGILEEKDQKSIIPRRYFKTAREKPWTLQFSDVSKSLFSTSSVLPTILGVQDTNGSFLGYLTLGLRLKPLTEQLEKIVYDPDVHFLVLDQQYNLVISSHKFLQREYGREGSLLKQKIVAKEFKSYTFKQLDIEFSVVQSFSKYPFLVLTGYNKSKMTKDLLQELAPSLLEFLIMGCLAMLLLSLFRRKIILPINKLYEACRQLAKGEQEPHFPHFNIQELDKLSEGLKLLSLVFSAYESNKKKLEENDKIAHRSDRAKEKHLNAVYQTLTQYLAEIRLCILGLRELSSLNVNDKALKLLETLDKKSDDILNADFADEEKTFFDLNQVLTECQMIYLKEASQEAIVIDFLSQPLPPYYGDQLKLKQILLSLLGKCLQSVPQEGHIRIETSAFVNQEETFVKIIISDNGFSEKILQRIERTLDMDQKIQQVGLMIFSLEKVQKMVEEEGGTLELFSHKTGRQYILTLSTTYLKLSSPHSLLVNVIPLNGHRPFSKK